MTKLGREAGAGLIIMSDTSINVYRKTIYSLAARYRLPTIYPYRFFAVEGGLTSYGSDAASSAPGCGLLRRPQTPQVKSQANLRSSNRPSLNWSSM